MIRPSLHPFTKMNVSNCDSKKCDGNCYPKNVLHKTPQGRFRLSARHHLCLNAGVRTRSNTPAALY
jgi:hypothetical protein